MKFEDFLKQSEQFNEIRLVGPLLKPEMPAFSTELPTLYIDGGLKFKSTREHLNFSLGDGDSSPHKPELLLNPEKDYSDLAFAMTQLPPHFTDVYLVGFLGGRKDHEWINLGVAYTFLTQQSKKSFVDFDRGQIVAYGAGNWRVNLEGSFSVICFEDTLLMLNGALKYPFKPKAVFPKFSSRGLSNEGFGQVHIENEKPILIIKN